VALLHVKAESESSFSHTVTIVVSVNLILMRTHIFYIFVTSVIVTNAGDSKPLSYITEVTSCHKEVIPVRNPA
jgi:hypothetical protein